MWSFVQNPMFAVPGRDFALEYDQFDGLDRLEVAADIRAIYQNMQRNASTSVASIRVRFLVVGYDLKCVCQRHLIKLRRLRKSGKIRPARRASAASDVLRRAGLICGKSGPRTLRKRGLLGTAGR
jgi:hypothetical protein